MSTHHGHAAWPRIMATLQERNGSYRVLFCFQGKQLSFTLGKVEPAEAEAKMGQVDLLLLRLSQRLAVIPPGMTITDYLKFDGRPLPAEAPEIKSTNLSRLKEKYIEANEQSLERTTLDCIRTHFRHLYRVMGAGFATLANLQPIFDSGTLFDRADVSKTAGICEGDGFGFQNVVP